MEMDNKASAFEKRLKMNLDHGELEPELVTPMTAGNEELPEYCDTFPMVHTFKQTNMRAHDEIDQSQPREFYSLGTQSQRGRDED
jgi:hypothetical protein